MKFFDFLVKIAFFWASLLFLRDSCHKLRPKIELGGKKIDPIIQPPSSIFGCNLWHKSPRKSREAQKRAFLTKKSKIFIKAKLTVSKSCLLGPVPFMNFCILRGAPLQKVKYWKGPSYDFWNFSYFKLPWHSSNSFCWVS